MHTTIHQINNNDLLYSTGNYKFLVITYNGKESEKQYYIYINKTELVSYIPETNTTLYNHYTSVNQPHKTMMN